MAVSSMRDCGGSNARFLADVHFFWSSCLDGYAANRSSNFVVSRILFWIIHLKEK
jgi:hypothetical protein